ncbi:MAG: hypothetical protein A2931_04310 [Candidatus Niyogibacteria bacterium RIFCSPLOWO2_01_FULL_45_48]|uniref:Cohesin domain-containing protein n=1 Tax=Candidatus Niyogibacteria bacterium RIFCSPLOWO2_01_FULL_45_48 TaxID=1801724 RepID=A0A1G2F1Z0_9BACT|nr:MAG: hypothetical protein A2931_04310 [Candidatus Niyogibacteria bacterium RIFCSPLOWO2_01_FULL_45_48]
MRKKYFLGLCLLFFALNTAQAATLYFSPSSGNFSVGDLLNTGVLVNTQNKAINNADSVINFPAALLEVVSLTKSGSIFSLWVEEPAFSNGAGTISFNGGLPTPGFNGTAGKILNIVFRVKNAGSASLIFSSAAVRANDGFGTDILQTRAPAQFSLVSEEKPVALPVAPGTPQAPRISSPSHPDSNKWYAKSTAELNWPISADINAVRLLVGKSSTAEPAVLYIPPITQRTVENLDDGIWYFSGQLRNSAGWGTIGRFRLQIDTEKPERFDVRLVSREDETDPRVKFTFESSDRTSGIDHYEIQIDGEISETWSDDGTRVYQTPVLEPGKHAMLAKAVDKAGNFVLNSIDFDIGALKPPVITEYPSELQSGEVIVIKGETYLNSEIVVWVQKDRDDPRKRSVRSDERGKFAFVDDERARVGVYKVWAEVVDSRGAKSGPSDEVSIAVRQLAILRIGTLAINTLSVIISIVGLISLLVFMSWHIKNKYEVFRKKIGKEAHEAARALHRAFDLLKEDVHKEIKALEKARTKRDLTVEEEKIVEQLKKDLDDAEKFVAKEIEDIEREARQ